MQDPSPVGRSLERLQRVVRVMVANGDKPLTTRARPRRYPPLRAMMWLLIVVGVVGGVIWGNVWWQERPLAEARRQLAAGELDAAQATVNGFLRAHPDHERGLALKARILVERGDSAAAIELFERVGAEDAEELHAWAKALLQQQSWTLARPLLEHLRRSGVDRADVLHELAACCAKLGDYAGALSAAEEFAQIPGFEARGQVLLGTIHREKGNLRLACAAWDRALELRPEADDLQIAPAEFLREFGGATISTGDPERAVELLEASWRLTPDTSTLALLGEAYAQRGSLDQAADALQRVVQADPENAAARVTLANIALTQRDAEAARAWLRPLEVAARVSSEAAFLLQRTYTMLGDDPSAARWKARADELRARERIEQVADQLLRDAPESSWAVVIRAYRFAEAGNWLEADRTLTPVLPKAQDQPFIMSLARAVELRGTLPDLSELPVHQF